MTKNNTYMAEKIKLSSMTDWLTDWLSACLCTFWWMFSFASFRKCPKTKKSSVRRLLIKSCKLSWTSFTEYYMIQSTVHRQQQQVHNKMSQMWGKHPLANATCIMHCTYNITRKDRTVLMSCLTHDMKTTPFPVCRLTTSPVSPHK